MILKCRKNIQKIDEISDSFFKSNKNHTLKIFKLKFNMGLPGVWFECYGCEDKIWYYNSIPIITPPLWSTEGVYKYDNHTSQATQERWLKYLYIAFQNPMDI